MGKISPSRRRSTIAIKNKRKNKVKKLRGLYVMAKSMADKKKIMDHALRISPYQTAETFASGIKEQVAEIKK